MSDCDPSVASEELQTLLRLVDAEQTRADVLMNVVIPIGVALAYEPEWDRLLKRIVTDAMKLCDADGGALYLPDESGWGWQPVIVRVDSIGLISSMKTAAGNEASCEPVGSGSTVAEAAQRGTTVNVPDVYEAGGEFAAEAERFDHPRGYRTVSCLAVPLRGQADQVIGVLRLVNARRPEDRQVCPFEPGMQQVIEALCLLAAAALDSYMRQQRLKDQVRELSIQIDETRKTKQVSQIVESDYFRALQGRARELRGSTARE